jgi:hypothetical protein
MSHRTHKGGLAEQHTERVFRDPAILALIAFGAVCLVIALLGGCANDGMVADTGLAESATSFASDRSTVITCRHFDPATGNMTSEVVVQRNLTPDQASVAALASVVGAVIGLAKAPAAVAMGASPGAAREQPAPQQDQACLLNHFPSDAAANRPVVVPGGQQSDPVEHGDNPRPVAPAPALYMAPFLDPDGVAHSADDGGSP